MKNQKDKLMSPERAKKQYENMMKSLNNRWKIESGKIRRKYLLRAAADFIHEDPKRLAKGWRFEVDRDGGRAFIKGKRRIVIV